jgi:ribonuclease G
LGGIIVIDFIDMGREHHRREVLNILKSALSADRAKYDILDISKFGLVEMTRERIHRTVSMLSYQDCPYCQGRGKVKSPVTAAIFALKELKKSLLEKHRPEVSLEVNPGVAQEILKDKEGLRLIERKFKATVSLISSPALHIEEIKIS